MQNSTPDFLIRPLLPTDRDRVRAFVTERWGAEIVVAHRVVYRPHELPGFAAWEGDSMVGLVTLYVVGNSCEVVSFDSLQPGKGIGTALLNAAIAYARDANCTRLWLITTNDNLNALRFYQKRGLVLVTVHRNALTRSRQLKPQIPLIGNDGIPLRDEIELEMMLDVES